MIKKIITQLGLSAVFTAALTFPVNAAPVVWDMPDEYPATSVQGEGDKYFAAVLKDKSNGEIEIAHHFGGALGFKSKDQLDAVGDGAVVLANTFIPPLGGIDPIFLLSSLPFLSSNIEEAKTLYNVAKPEYQRVLTKYNQKLLYSSPWLSSGLWGKEALINNDVVNNLKMRTYDVNGTKVFRNAGSAPIQLSWADIVPQLSTGGIDGVLTSIEAGLSGSFNDYVSHFTALNYDSTINLVTINLDTWNDLSPELQQAVTDAAAETEAHLWTGLKGIVEETYAEARGKGLIVVEDVPTSFRSELKSSAQPIIQEWLEKMGPRGEKLLAEYRAAIAKNVASN
ncbi:TRAP transporter substrate-binding protein [Amphritea sp. 1_MG-2023]|uniref:TRAP transporter substrate-binding protein n=1 Tax=Amphritea sp. 1_MG-2023 TaxID=3062670 RepID=UPI0026E3DA8A|nr:TRAP transporter substrate-binding protein [Amphritea sp. 1_MG-2023]MDO6564541.1 TRAP transporter substrate-binding protein [Amphritea sp. 1_MG-2023]